jgi:hypothetical protein
MIRSEKFHEVCDEIDWVAEDMDEIRKIVHRLTVECITPCRHCILISEDIAEDRPILCGKLVAQRIDVDTCFACGEYKQIPSLL